MMYVFHSIETIDNVHALGIDIGKRFLAITRLTFCIRRFVAEVVASLNEVILRRECAAPSRSCLGGVQYQTASSLG